MEGNTQPGFEKIEDVAIFVREVLNRWIDPETGHVPDAIDYDMEVDVLVELERHGVPASFWATETPHCNLYVEFRGRFYRIDPYTADVEEIDVDTALRVADATLGEHAPKAFRGCD